MKSTEEKWIVWTKSLTGIYVPNSESLSYTRSESINKFVKGTRLTWRQWRTKYDVKCIKTSITYEPIEQ